MKYLLGFVVLSVAIGFLFANRPGIEIPEAVRDEAFFLEKEVDLVDDLSVSESAVVDEGESAIVSARELTNQARTNFSGTGMVVGMYNDALDMAGLSYINSAQSQEDFSSILKKMKTFNAESDLKVEIWYQWDSSEKIRHFYRYLLSRGIAPQIVKITQIDRDAFGAQIIADARKGTFSTFELE